MNVIQIAGHLGNDPEVRFTPSGQKVTSFRVAARARGSNKEGTDNTIWWNVTVWGERFDKMISYFKKGSSIIVVGEMRKPSIYTNRDGQPQPSMEITAEMLMFSPFGKSSSNGGANQQQQGVVQGFQKVEGNTNAEPSFEQPVGAGMPTANADMDDQIPF